MEQDHYEGKKFKEYDNIAELQISIIDIWKNRMNSDENTTNTVTRCRFLVKPKMKDFLDFVNIESLALDKKIQPIFNNMKQRRIRKPTLIAVLLDLILVIIKYNGDAECRVQAYRSKVQVLYLFCLSVLFAAMTYLIIFSG